MDWQTGLAIGALVVSIASAVFTFISAIRVAKISHVKDLHEYEKKITYFELQFKDEMWLYDLFKNDEFHKYNYKSQKRILKWWKKYQETHPTILLDKEVEFNKHLISMCIGPEAIMKKEKELKDKEKGKDDGSLDW